MPGGCEWADLGAEEYAKGAQDLATFASRMKAKIGNADPDVMQALFQKAADRYRSSGGAELDGIKQNLALELAKLNKTGLGNALLSARKAGLIASPRTYAKIAASNTITSTVEQLAKQPAAVMDMVLSKATGNRRTLGVLDYNAARQGIASAVTKGLADSAEIMKNGATPEQLLKMQFPKEIHTGIAALDAYTNTIFRSHGALYQPFKEFAFKQSMVEQANLLAKQTGKSAADIIAHPPEDMVVQATGDAEQAVFLNANKASSMIGAAKRMPGGGAVDFVIPFDKVPSNIVGRSLEYSGVGTVYEAGKAVSRMMTGEKVGNLVQRAFPDSASQVAFSKAFGRGVIGVPTILLGIRLAQKGLLSPSESPTTGEKGEMQAAGIPQASLKIGKNRVRIADSPIGTMLAVGANIAHDKGNPAIAGGKGLLETTSNLPYLQGVSTLTEGLSNPDKGWSKFAKAGVASLIPNPLGDLASVTNPGVRKVTTVGDAAINKIPFLRGNLPIQHDALGRPLQAPNPLDPFRTIQQRDDPAVQAVLRNEVSLSVPVQFKGESPAAHEARVAKWGAITANAINAATTKPRYQSETSETARRYMLTQAIKDVRTKLSEGTPHETPQMDMVKQIRAERGK